MEAIEEDVLFLEVGILEDSPVEAGIFDAHALDRGDQEIEGVCVHLAVCWDELEDTPNILLFNFRMAIVQNQEAPPDFVCDGHQPPIRGHVQDVLAEAHVVDGVWANMLLQQVVVIIYLLEKLGFHF